MPMAGSGAAVAGTLLVSGAGDGETARAAGAAFWRASGTGRVCVSASCIVLGGGGLAVAPHATARLLPPGAARFTVLVGGAGGAPRPHDARLMGAFVVPEARDALGALLRRLGSGWAVRWALAGAGGQVLSPEEAAERATTFSVFKLGDAEGTEAAAAAALSPEGAAGPAAPAALRAGEEVALVGSPFGALAPEHFHAAVTRGCVSNDGAGGGIALLDVRSWPGMEGAAVLTTRGQLAGVLLPPACRGGEAATELPLALSWAPVARALAAFLLAGTAHSPVAATAADSNAPSCSPDDGGVLDTARRSVVLVAVAGGRWASGVVLSAPLRLVLTNAHLLDPGEARQPLRVRLPPGAAAAFSWRPARLVRAFSNGLDLAVLQFEGGAAAQDATTTLRRPALADDARLAEGAACAIAGHGLLGPAAALPASLTRGTLARVVRGGDGAGAAMLTLTARVDAGASGGAVLAADGGYLLGLACSNARHASSGATLPHLAFAIAAPELRPLWTWAEAGEAAGALDVAVLEALDADCPARRRLWALEPPPVLSRL
jgi:S1-C subfamily serine protease